LKQAETRAESWPRQQIYITGYFRKGNHLLSTDSQYLEGSRSLVCSTRLPSLLPCFHDESVVWFWVSTAEVFLLYCPPWWSGRESVSCSGMKQQPVPSSYS